MTYAKNLQLIALFYAHYCARIDNYVILKQSNFLELKDSMKHVRFIFCIVSIFFLSTNCMEKSPRSLERYTLWNQQEVDRVQSLIYIIESDASYPNPHAPARINQAGTELLKSPTKELISFFWSKSEALKSAKILHQRAAQTVVRCWASPLADSSVMLLEQAYLIALAVEELNKTIEQLS